MSSRSQCLRMRHELCTLPSRRRGTETHSMSTSTRWTYGQARETRIVAQPGRDAEPSYSPDGRWIAFHSQAGSANYFEARHVAIVSSEGGPSGTLPRVAIGMCSEMEILSRGQPIRATSRTQLVKVCVTSLSNTISSDDRATIIAEEVCGPASCTVDGSRCVFLKTSPERPTEVYLWQSRTAAHACSGRANCYSAI